MKHLIIAVTIVLLSFNAGAEDKQCSGLKSDNLQYDSFFDFSKELNDETYYKLQEDLNSLSKTGPIQLTLCFVRGILDCKVKYFYGFGLTNSQASAVAADKCIYDAGATRCEPVYCRKV